MAYTRKRDGALILTPIRKVPDEKVALSNIKRLTFAYKLSGNTNTLPDHLDAVTEVFEAFDNARDKNLTPDCIALNFETASDRPIDLARLYPQLENFLDPFVTRNYHTPALSIVSRLDFTGAHELRLELIWQDKSYEQLIKRSPATWRSQK